MSWQAVLRWIRVEGIVRPASGSILSSVLYHGSVDPRLFTFEPSGFRMRDVGNAETDGQSKELRTPRKISIADSIDISPDSASVAEAILFREYSMWCNAYTGSKVTE
jgi:hypothetical protein